jgi:hypothetical protein
LDFFSKPEIYKIKVVRPTEQGAIKEWCENREKQWAELVKDVISLTNGNVGTHEETGYLIIGVADKLKSDGTRHLQDVVSKELPTRSEILDKVNSYCNPPIPDIKRFEQELDGKKLFVIEIPPSPYLHRLSRQLEPPKSQGGFSSHALLIRRKDGEKIYVASSEEQEALQQEKRKLIQGENMPKSRMEISPEVYDRRIAVYRSIRKFLSLIMTHANVTLEQLREFSQETDEAIFLFDSSVANYIQILYQKAVKLRYTREVLSSSQLSVGEEISSISRESSELLMWFTEQINEVRSLMYKYISFDTHAE